jgi:hypothetical protein
MQGRPVVLANEGNALGITAEPPTEPPTERELLITDTTDQRHNFRADDGVAQTPPGGHRHR